MRQLIADKPILSLDIETTGLDKRNDRIVELSIVWSPHAADHFTQRFNPGIPIPKAASDVHGITDVDIANEPHFTEFAASIADKLSHCYLTGFNLIGYDIPMLTAEMERCGIDAWPGNDVHVVDSHLIFKKREPRTLSKAVEYYLDRDHQGAHGAYADALASLQILHAQVSRYVDLPTSMAELITVVHGKNKIWVDSQGKLEWRDIGLGVMHPVFTMGKVNGYSLQQVAKTHRGYLSWIIKSDFESDLKQICTDALRNKFPKMDA